MIGYNKLELAISYPTLFGMMVGLAADTGGGFLRNRLVLAYTPEQLARLEGQAASLTPEERETLVAPADDEGTDLAAAKGVQDLDSFMAYCFDADIYSLPGQKEK